jgi:hypothetical protein
MNVFFFKNGGHDKFQSLMAFFTRHYIGNLQISRVFLSWKSCWLINYILCTSHSVIFHLYVYVGVTYMLGVQHFWAGRGICCATPAVTLGFGFSGLIRWTIPFILPLTTHKVMQGTCSKLDPPGSLFQLPVSIRKVMLIGDLLIWSEDLFLLGSPRVWKCCFSIYIYI